MSLNSIKSQQITNFKTQKWIAAISVFLFVTKVIAYELTHSVSILTDALESVVNIIAGLLGLYSLFLSMKPKDANHPYGHGKIEFVSASVEGIMIVIAGIIILFKSVEALFISNSIEKLDWGILLIAFSALVNFIMGSISVKNGKKNQSLALIASGKHLQTDTYSTLGIIVGLVLIYFTQILWLDSLVAFIFGVVIIYTGFKIFRKSLAGIMDEADEEILVKMIDLLNKNRRENWVDLHNLRIIKYGSILHLDCHLTVPWYQNVHEAHAEIDILADLVRKEFGESLELFVHSDGCLPFSCRICQKKDCRVRIFEVEQKIEWNLQNVTSNKKHQLETLN